jgi:hypothetical protein
MKPNQDPKLEARITRELKSLGELPAPAGFASRVLRAIEQREAMPWYRRAWTTWPQSLQMASVLVLAAAFAGICWLAGGVSQSAGEAVAAQKQTGWLAQLGLVWELVRVMGEATAAVINHIGKGTIVAIGLLIATAYAACVGLGTAYVRFALQHARRS